MKVRDRLIVAVIGAVLVIGAVWLLLVSPERDKASSLGAKITTEQSALASAQASLASARNAAAGYVGDVHELGQVTIAVPTGVNEPSILQTIDRLAGTNVDVHEVDVGSAGATAQGAVATGLTFTFNATYDSLQNFLSALDRLTRTDGTSISAAGRLFTVSGITFAPEPPNATKVTVTADAFSQGAPAGATGATGATGTTATAAVAP